MEGDTYELRRINGDDVAIHISTFDRPAQRVEEGEAEEMLGDLMEGSAPPGTVGRTVDLGDGLHRAVARFQVEGDEFSGDGLAFVVVADGWAVGATCFAAKESPAVDEAERMFATIAEVPRRRGLFRRR